MHMCVRTKEEKETEISERNTEGRYVRYVRENVSSENALHYRIYIYTYTILRVK